MKAKTATVQVHCIRITIFLLIFSNICEASCQKTDFSRLDRLRLDTTILEVKEVTNGISCARQCAKAHQCAATNLQLLSNVRMRCELLAEELGTLVTDVDSVVMVKQDACESDFIWVSNYLGLATGSTVWNPPLTAGVCASQSTSCACACLDNQTCWSYAVSDNTCSFFSSPGGGILTSNILSATESTDEGGIMVKHGRQEMIFANTNCDSGLMLPGDGGSSSFDIHAPAGHHVTSIHLCASGHGYLTDIFAGFDMFFSDGSQQSALGCYQRRNPFPAIDLNYDEVIVKLDVYYGRNNGWEALLVQAITFYTTMRVLGPYGLTAEANVTTFVGYNLQGFYGRNGFALDNIGAYSSRC